MSSSWLRAHRSLLFFGVFGFFRRQRQPEHRDHSLSGDIHFRLRRIGQVKRLAVFAAVNFGAGSPRFFGIAARLLEDVRGIEPALQMAAAELSLFVLLVAGALPGL